MEENKTFLKLFKITEKYLKKTYLYKDLASDTISEDTIRRYITLFNEFKLLKKTSLGLNVFRDDLFDKNIFDDIHFNAFTISALINTKHQLTTEIFKYIFKDSVTETRKQFKYKYDKFFNEKVFCLANNEKYIKILNQRVYNRTNSSKLSMEYEINNRIYKLIIIDMFIHEDSWFVVAYNIDSKKLEIYNQYDIKSFKNPKDNIQIKYIDIKILENIIVDFIESRSSSKEEILYVKAPLGIINNLLSTEIINDFEAYYENQNYIKNDDYENNFEEDDFPFMMSKYNPSTSNRRIIKKKINQDIIYISKLDLNNYQSKEVIDIINFPDDLEYYGFSNDKLENYYIFEIKTTSLKKNFIIQNFKGQVEILNKSSIKII
ncbi:hypothetical protein ACRCD7_06045 [Aliarcobacter sp. ERUVET-7]|uniref:hypothetical protein n=1 Tax=Aliarcobacter sp. ERUVET-7 TaxID=3429683 RepID=UPI003D6BFC55